MATTVGNPTKSSRRQCSETQTMASAAISGS